MRSARKENMEPLGLQFIKLGLQDVLYDPKTKVVYTPNTNQSNKLGGEKEGRELKFEQKETEKKSLLTGTSTSQTEKVDQSQTEKGGYFIERIAPGVFRRAIAKADEVKILLNHKWDKMLGGTKSLILH